MRWLMPVLTVFGFALAFLAKGPGLLGLGIVLVFVGLFGTVLSVAAERVSASARPDSAMASPDVLAAMRTPRTAATARPTPAIAKPVAAAPASKQDRRS